MGGLDPRPVADRHDPVADVYRAPTYYYHPEEMRQVGHQRRSAVEGHAHLTTDLDELRD
jgi:hypothetical protein